MANTSARTLALLQAHRYWPGPQLAERLEVSVRTLRRDVDRLRELGYPVTAHRGVDGGYQLAPGATLPPLVLDDEEAVALAVALQAATHGPAAGMAESAVRALTKVVQVMPPRLRRRVDTLRAMTVPAVGATPGPIVEARVLVLLAQACRDHERLQLAYTAARGEQTDRHVEPHRLVSLGRRWYLVAYDLTRHDWRSFRLDRLQQPRSTGAAFRPRELPAADAATFVRNGIDDLPAPYTVEVLVHAPAADVRHQIGQWAKVDSVDAGCCRVRMSTNSLDWPAMALGAVGADFTVLTPPELLAHLQDWAHRFHRATTRSDTQ